MENLGGIVFCTDKTGALTEGEGCLDLAGQGCAAVRRLAFTVTQIGASPAAVPPMTEWALILFGMILASGAALYIQRRRQFA